NVVSGVRGGFSTFVRSRNFIANLFPSIKPENTVFCPPLPINVTLEQLGIISCTCSWVRSGALTCSPPRDNYFHAILLYLNFLHDSHSIKKLWSLSRANRKLLCGIKCLQEFFA